MSLLQVLPSSQQKYDDDEAVSEAASLPQFPSLPSANAWDMYNTVAKRFDIERQKSWNMDLDVLLIVAALFASVTSSFSIFGLPMLQDNTSDSTQAILLHISQQLANSTLPAASISTTARDDPWVKQVNLLFLLSLSLDVLAVFLAMLAKQWVSEMNRGIERIGDKLERALHRQVRYDGVEQWKLDAIISALPTLLHLSILLFFAGISRLLFQYEQITAIVITTLFLLGFGLYIAALGVSIIVPNSPFIGPLGRAVNSVLQVARKRFHPRLPSFYDEEFFDSYWRYRRSKSRHVYEQLGSWQEQASTLIVRALAFLWDSPGVSRDWQTLVTIQSALPVRAEKPPRTSNDRILLRKALPEILDSLYSRATTHIANTMESINICLVLLDDRYDSSWLLPKSLFQYLGQAMHHHASLRDREWVDDAAGLALCATSLKRDTLFASWSRVPSILQEEVLPTIYTALLRLSTSPVQRYSLVEDAFHESMASYCRSLRGRFEQQPKSSTIEIEFGPRFVSQWFRMLLRLGNLWWDEKRKRDERSWRIEGEPGLFSGTMHSQAIFDMFTTHFLLAVPPTETVSPPYDPLLVVSRLAQFYELDIDPEVYSLATIVPSQPTIQDTRLIIDTLRAYLGIMITNYGSTATMMFQLECMRLLLALIPRNEQTLAFKTCFLSFFQSVFRYFQHDIFSQQTECLRLVAAALWTYAKPEEIVAEVIISPSNKIWVGEVPLLSHKGAFLPKQANTLVLVLDRWLVDATSSADVDLLLLSRVVGGINMADVELQTGLINSEVWSRFDSISTEDKQTCRDLATNSMLRDQLTKRWRLGVGIATF